MEKRQEDSEVYGGVCDDGFTDTTAATLCSYFGWTRGRKGPSQLLRNETSYVSTRLTCEGERLGSCKDRPYPDSANSTEYMCAPHELASVYCFNGEKCLIIHVLSQASASLLRLFNFCPPNNPNIALLSCSVSVARSVAADCNKTI